MPNFSNITVDKDVYNLIPSRFPTADLYEDIAPSDQWDEIVKIESFTNPRIIQKRRMEKLQKSASEDQLQNWNLAPLSYPNPDGTTFFDPSLKCVELYDNRKLALSISINARETFLRDACMPPMQVDVRMFKRRLNGSFADLRDHVSKPRSNRWQIGEEIAANDDFQGVAFSSLRAENGTIYGIINGRSLGRVIQCEHYSFYWNGNKITKIYSYHLGREFSSISEVQLAEINAA